jgi:cell division initiation protein
MDVSPRALRAVTFREKLRGYHPDDVDQFLERVAEGVAALQAKLEEALGRADRAEQERTVATEGEDAVQRTLKLAQRTADLALKEAKDEATRLVTEARNEASRLAEEAQRALRADLERLEAARTQLHSDVLAMQQYVDQERTRVRTVLADLLRKVDGTARRAPAPPVAAKIDVPAPPARRIVAEPPASSASPEVSSVPSPVPVPVPVPDSDFAFAGLPEPAEPVEPAELTPVAHLATENGTPADGPAPASSPAPTPPRFRREPQPPPVSGTPFGAARPSSGPPSGPPPGPRRAEVAPDPSPSPVQDDDTVSAANDEPSGFRRLLGR